MLIGWNSIWDTTYFLTRCKRRKVNVDKDMFRSLDIMQFYRYSVNRSRYSLSYVAKEFNETKPHEKERIKMLSNEEVRERNMWDVLMTEKVDKKYRFTELSIKLAQMSHLFPDEVLGKREDKNTVTPSPVHTNIILSRSRKLGYVIPSMTPRKHVKYPGAYIHLPKAGIYSNVAQYDFTSLYPNIIVGFQIVPYNKTDVFIPLLKEYLQGKEKAKDEVEYMAFKLLANSFYGYFSS
ncbi:MAG: DNA polymerase domain-containing protein, partial [Fervidobacterium sp.]